jgi:hypothetical protein
MYQDALVHTASYYFNKYSFVDQASLHQKQIVFDQGATCLNFNLHPSQLPVA